MWTTCVLCLHSDFFPEGTHLRILSRIVSCYVLLLLPNKLSSNLKQNFFDYNKRNNSPIYYWYSLSTSWWIIPSCLSPKLERKPLVGSFIALDHFLTFSSLIRIIIELCSKSLPLQNNTTYNHHVYSLPLFGPPEINIS